MITRMLRFSSVLRNAISPLNQIRNWTNPIDSPPYHQFLLRRRLTASAQVLQQIAPASSTNSSSTTTTTTTMKDQEKKPNANAPPVTVTFVTAEGEHHTVKGKEGDSLLDVVIDNQVPLDGFGACEGTLACSTCHVVLTQKDFDDLPDRPSDEELDMLDLAYGLSDTSRLGCQICLKKENDGLVLNVPASVHDAREDK